MPPKYSVRPATAADAEGILECLRRAFAPYEQLYTPAGFHDTVLSSETIHHRLRTMAVFVAVSESGEIVGTIGCSAVASDQQSSDVSVQSANEPMSQSANQREGHIRGMAVLPDFHGTGLAQALLRAAESELRQRGCIRATLDTTEPLQRAIRFYERNGYRASGRVADFFGMPLFEYVKRLAPE